MRQPQSLLEWSWKRGVPLLSALLLLAVCLYAFYRFPSKPAFLVPGLFGLFLAWALRRWSDALARIPGPVFLAVLLAVFLVSRWLWITQVPTQPFSDFAAYDFLANLLEDGRPFEVAWPYRTYAWGYPLFLAGWYQLAGNGLLAAKLLNLLLGAAALLLVYVLARRFGEPVGRVTAILFTIWPAQAAYSSVLASEHLALVFILAGLVCLFYFLGKSAGSPVPPHSWRVLPLAGALLSLAYLTRSALLTVTIAALIALWLPELPVRTRIFHSGMLLVGFGLAYGIILQGMSLVYDITLQPQVYMNLLTGSNLEYSGAWNPQDSLRFMSYPTIEEANAFARKTILRRVRSQPIGYAKMMVKKVFRLWENETYAAEWSTERLEPGAHAERVGRLAERMRAASQAYHVLLLFFACAGCVWIFITGKANPPLALLLLALLLGTALHTVFETQPRYHYVMEVIVMVMAAIGLTKLRLNRVNAGTQPAAGS